jgi:hypothetical protein
MSDGTRMLELIHVLIMVSLAMVVSYNLNILHFDKQASLSINN